MRLRATSRLTGLAIGVLVGATPAFAEYRVQPGDTLDVSVAGLPDLKQRSVVGLDGEAVIPMIAPVKVGGLGLSDVQLRIKEQLSRKIFQQRLPDGRESVSAISPDSVTVTIAEYRPVYLNGDVTKPGEQAYRPGMTVRQAVALAGGYEIMRFRMNNPFLESADLRADYQTLWLKFVTQQATLWRLRSELAALGGQAAASPEGASLETVTQAPLPKEALDGVRMNARAQLDATLARRKAERTFLIQNVKVTDDQLGVLRA
ncbi:MAG: polysaccharide biosynthesis/export family protein, partial [Methylobacteriaceae bacterium]|nr:polysaccharide biosynthesis/export family protein [Methylobacteriaceae bacterium]